MRKTYLIAAIIAVAMIVWLASGQFSDEDRVAEHPTIAELNTERSAVVEDKAANVVRVRVIHAQPTPKTLKIRGRTENKRTVDVRAETAGRIVNRPVERGDDVKQGDLLCEIALDDRGARVTEADEAVEQARIEFEGAQRLKAQGLQSETGIAQAKARLASAQARLASAELDIARTMIRAPFRGVIEKTHVEIGDYAQPGGACVSIVDMDPMLLVGQVSENDVHFLELGRTAIGKFPTGGEVRGPITFVGQQAEQSTRTYRVEVTLANPDRRLRSGITTQIRIDYDSVLAQKVSPALFALDDAGRVGVRTVDADQRVEFHLVEIVADDVDGVWVTGLPDRTTLITVGQEFVVAGERVDIQYEEELAPFEEELVSERGDPSLPLAAGGANE